MCNLTENLNLKFESILDLDLDFLVHGSPFLIIILDHDNLTIFDNLIPHCDRFASL